MFQSLKKWVKNEDVQQSGLSPPSGMQLMKGDLQRKFAKGVQYNMKIVIRGDRNTGKTCLLQRLKGGKFMEEYIPTAEIQVASIHWDYKATDDIVKVDVWDIVDQGKSKKKESKGLKITTEKSAKDVLEQQVLDASFLDVYKQTHAVIMMFDVTKKWTFSYIERELPKVPNHIPVLVLANFRDMGNHRVVTFDEAEALVESIDRPPGSPSVMLSESSMKNGFGLKYVHKFFNMPFLLVQRESLLKQLETNHLDLESCMEELSTEEHGYDEFMQRVQDAQRKGQTKLQPTPEAATSPANEKRTEPTAHHASSTKTTSPSTSLEVKAKAVAEERSQQVKNDPPSPVGKEGLFSPSQMEEQTMASPPAEPEKRGFMSRLFKRSSNEPTTSSSKELAPQQINIPQNASTLKPVSDVDEFVPDEGHVNDFLDEIPDYRERATTNTMDSSDDDENAGNPMVMGFQEEIDSDDDFGPSHKGPSYSLSDSEPEVEKPQRKLPQKKEIKPAQIPKQILKPAAHIPNLPQTAQTHKRMSDSDEDSAGRPEVTQDFDLSSTDEFFESKSDFAVMAGKAEGSAVVVSDVLMSTKTTAVPETLTIPDKIAVQEHSDESEDDTKPNAMVSKGYDDISSNDESTLQPPVAIVTPVQAQRTMIIEDDETGSKPASGLNLEFSMTDLNFLEQSSKRPDADVDDSRRSSKDSSSKSHRSKKSASNRRSEEDGAVPSVKKPHKKHKKHRTKDGEEREHSKSEGSKSRHSRDGKERKKKIKSKEPEKSAKTENADDDLEAFLSGM